jgi:DNA replication protein DnaC
MTVESQRCAKCDGDRYRIEVAGSHATAVRCDCSSVCPDCHGSGVRYVEKGGATFAAACDCVALDRRIATYNAATIPAKFAGRFIEDIEELDREGTQKRAKYALLEHRDRFAPGERGFLLWGNPGVGKTHMLCGLIAYLALERGLSCRYVDFMQLIYDLKQGFSQNRWESEVVGPLLAVDVLVIDELGKGRNSEWELSILDELISARYNARKTIHCTSNYAPEAAAGPAPALSSLADGGPGIAASLQERLGERIFSRLCEMCRFQEVRGEDYRRRVVRKAAPRKTGTKDTGR